MGILQNIKDLNLELASTSAKLVAVSKTYSSEIVKEAYDAGQRIFGENKVQEMVEKYQQLPQDIQWHLIGHLQKNKVKYIAEFVSLIHSVDSLELLKEINKQALKNDRVISCLFQVYIAKEETKFGLSEVELQKLIFDSNIAELNNVKIVGLMGMATNTSDSKQIYSEFETLKKVFDSLKLKNLPQNVDLHELSMGMSSDYKIAIQLGSTMVRVGSLIFGKR